MGLPGRKGHGLGLAQRFTSLGHMRYGIFVGRYRQTYSESHRYTAYATQEIVLIHLGGKQSLILQKKPHSDQRLRNAAATSTYSHPMFRLPAHFRVSQFPSYSTPGRVVQWIYMNNSSARSDLLEPFASVSTSASRSSASLAHSLPHA